MPNPNNHRSKQQLDQTPEPKRRAGSTRRQRQRRQRSATGPVFVIQKHSASTLHYDFRLELDGVLLSWSIPKGPSRNPAHRRLATETEPCPLDYGDIEGVIPKGERDAGKMIIWERGTWSSEGDPRAQYDAGRLEFTLNGHKLAGRWRLVRRGDSKRWLLIKSRDEFAVGETEPAVVDRLPHSILTGLTVDDVKKTRQKVAPARSSSSIKASTANQRGSEGKSQRARPAKAASTKVATTKTSPAKAVRVSAKPSGDEAGARRTRNERTRSKRSRSKRSPAKSTRI